MEIVPKPDSVRCISSPKPFYINGVKVWCATPLHIYDGEATKVKIEPLHYLGQDFVRGWNKLPEKLKLNVLRFNLVHHDPIEHYNAFHGDHRSVTSYGSHLRSTPELAALSRIVYYSLNTFNLSEESISRSNSIDYYLVFAYPKPTVNLLIQSLEIHYRLFMPGRAMEHLVQGRYGFQNLRSLRVTIEYEEPRIEDKVRFFLGRTREPYRFGCTGLLEFVVPYFGRLKDGWEDKAAALIERLQPWSIFGCSKAKRGIVAEADEMEGDENNESIC